MWRRLMIALLCAAVSWGFDSNTPAGAPLVNPPNGQNNYLPINTPTWTGAGAGPTLNLTGTAPSLTFNGIAMGAVCPAGQFVSTLSATGVPTCTTPPGPAAGSVTDAMLANPYSGVGACGANTFASTLTRNAAPTCTQPAFSNLSGTVTDAQLANAYSGVGACPANQFASTLTRNAAPTCTTPSFAPLVNVGANNYAPLASPTFTGTTTVANLTAPSTATWTFPDGSTYTSAGHNNMKNAGVGYNIPADITGNSVLTTGIYSPSVSTAFLALDSGLYPVTGGFRVTSTDGTVYHTIQNGHEYGFFMDNGLTTGSVWNGSPRSQYMALRDPLAGSGAGLTVETGYIQALNGGYMAGSPTGGNEGLGSYNGTKYYVNGVPLTQVLTGQLPTMGYGSTSVFTVSDSFYACSYVEDGLADGLKLATCSISLSWSAYNGGPNNVVNIGYLPSAAARPAGSTSVASWFSPSAMSGINIPSGCWVTGVINPGQTWVTLAYSGPSAECGAGNWLGSTANLAASGSITLNGTFLSQ